MPTLKQMARCHIHSDVSMLNCTHSQDIFTNDAQVPFPPSSQQLLESLSDAFSHLSKAIQTNLQVACVILRELVLVHDRNPESMRTVPRVCAAGRDSVPRRAFFFAFFSKNRPRREKWLEIKCFGYLETTFLARNFSDFFGFSTSPNIASCCAPGTSGIWDFHFLLGVGI